MRGGCGVAHHLPKFHRHSSLANGHGRAGVLSLSKIKHTHTKEEGRREYKRGEDQRRERERERRERNQVTGGSRQEWGP
jgi:hypothetical protein